MFEITYYGGNAIEIATKDAALIFDGRRDIFGKKNLEVKDAVQFGTEERLMSKSDAFRVSLWGAGEYEASNIMVRGLAAISQLDDPTMRKESTVFTLSINDYRVAVIGNITDTLTDEQVELLSMIDILILPVGGHGYTIEPETAAKIIGQITPKIVVPIHYAENGYNYEVPQVDFQELASLVKAEVVEEKTLKIKPGMTLPATLTIYKLAAQ